jgi:hypothetical protein
VLWEVPPRPPDERVSLGLLGGTTTELANTSRWKAQVRQGEGDVHPRLWGAGKVSGADNRPMLGHDTGAGRPYHVAVLAALPRRAAPQKLGRTHTHSHLGLNSISWGETRSWRELEWEALADGTEDRADTAP